MQPRGAAGCDGISVSGSTNQPDINGCFVDRSSPLAGFPAYMNKNKMLLYYKHREGWAIGSLLLNMQQIKSVRAQGNGEGDAGPTAVASWKTWRRSDVESKSWTSAHCAKLCELLCSDQYVVD